VADAGNQRDNDADADVRVAGQFHSVVVAEHERGNDRLLAEEGHDVIPQARLEDSSGRKATLKTEGSANQIAGSAAAR
jgi:hypothetical protein